MKLHNLHICHRYTAFIAIIMVLIAASYPFNDDFAYALSKFYNEAPDDAITIIIDPGHGGVDHGCTGSKSKEKDINLSISKILGQLLADQAPQVNIVFTRKADHFVSLKDRIDIANEVEGDLFISFHCNSNSVEYVTGSETYVAGLEFVNAFDHTHEQVRLSKEDILNFKANDISKPQKMVYLKKSLDFASIVESEFGNQLPFKSRGVKEAGYTVLKYIRMPGVLVEAGFLSNKKQEKYFNSIKGQEQVATSLLSSIQKYLDQQKEVKQEFARQDHTFSKKLIQLPRAPRNKTFTGTL